MARPPSKGVVSKRLIKLTGDRLKAHAANLDLAVVAYFCERRLNVVDSWVETGRINGGSALRLWHLFDVADIRQPELTKVRKTTPHGEYLGRLLVFGIVTPAEAREIAGNVNTEAVFAGARGERDFLQPTFSYDELVEGYGAKLTEKVNLLRQWLKDGLPKELLPEVEVRKERKRTRGGQPVEPVRLPPGVVPMTFGSAKSVVATTASRMGVKHVAPTDAEPQPEPARDVMPEEAPDTKKESVIEGTDVIEGEQSTAEPTPETDAPTDPAASWTSGLTTATSETPLSEEVETVPSEEADPEPGADLTEVEPTPEPAEAADAQSAAPLDIDALADALMDHLGLDKQQLTAFLVSQQNDSTMTVPVDRLLDADRREKVYELAQNLKKIEVDLLYILNTFSEEELTLLRTLIGDNAFYNIKLLATQLTGWRAQQMLSGGQNNG